MSLAQVEKLFNKKKIPFFRGNKELVVSTKSTFARLDYSVVIGEQKEGTLFGVVHFADCIAAYPHKPEELCKIMNKSLRGEAELGFNAVRKVFFVRAFLDGRRLLKGIATVTGACDFLYPVCQHVAEQGTWDAGLIALALCNPDDLARA